jgi:hypothetical protein
MIPQRNLSLLSNRLARAGGRRVIEAVLERGVDLTSWTAFVRANVDRGHRGAFHRAQRCARRRHARCL